MPYDEKDPRSALGSPSSGDVSTATAFASAQFISFTDEVAERSELGTRTWVVRTQNAAVAFSSGVATDTLRGMGEKSERLLALTNDDGVVRLTHNGESLTVSGRSVVVVPPGPVRIEFVEAGCLLQVFSSVAADVLDRSINAESYRSPAPNVEIHNGQVSVERSIKLYRLSEYPNAGDRFGSIFRSTNLMVNVIDDCIGARDATKLSPHFHADFEQLSIQTVGEFCHHVRTPWTPNLNAWSEDRHYTMRGPGAAVFPPPLVHTSEATGLGLNRLIDAFSPPREDFMAKQGWVLNAKEYEPEERGTCS